MAVLNRTMRITLAFGASSAVAVAFACGPMPGAAGPNASTENQGKTTVTVTKGSVEEGSSPTSAWPPPEPASSEVVAATPLEPAPNPILGASTSLVPGSTAEGPLAMPTTIAATKSTMFVFGKTRTSYVVRVLSLKWDNKGSYGPPIDVAPAYEGDAEPAAAADADGAWFGVSSKDGGAPRIVRVDAAGKVTASTPPAKLGRIAVFVPVGAQAAVIGQSGTSITFARVKRDGAGDATAKTIGQAALPTPGSRSPRAVREEDKVLVAWDGRDLAGALESPGTTDAERAAPKPGIYVQRFSPSGEPASPLRRLTRPSFEAHTLDVAVELGACAVLASTPDGYEMFRFVRKGNDLGPYGGGLFLASASATNDIALSTDAYGTLAVTSKQLLRIGPGVKIVPAPLGFQPPPGGNFDVIRVATDGLPAGSVAHVVLSTKVGHGLVPTIARIDGEKMGQTLPTPWIGPPPQEIAFGAFDGDEALALVIDPSSMQAVRIAANGAAKGANALSSAVKPDDLVWEKAPVPRVAHAGDAWVVSLKDGRVLVATGPAAGTMIALGKPGSAAVGGYNAVVSSSDKPGLVRVFHVPPPERLEAVWSATIDPAKGEIVDPWWEVAGTEKHFGALGGAHLAAAARKAGGLYLISNSGPKVPLAAQLFELLTLGADGTLISTTIGSDAPAQDLVLADALGGPALIATLTGEGTAVRWPDAGGGWKKSFAFHPFEARGDGPILRDKDLLALPTGHLPFVVQGEWATLLGERCPIVAATAPRALLLVCHEGSGLAPRVVSKTVTF